MGGCILNVENINVYYGAIHAIKDVSFKVSDGEIVALIGANGAGKSTTLKTLSGLLRSNTGTIEFMGEDIMHAPADKLVARGLAHVPRQARLRADERRGEPRDGCLHVPQLRDRPRPRARVRAFPAPEGAPPPGCRHALRR